ncbi:MAG TPA: glutamyl-tRNA reductase [Nocardioidaceae bacterium]|nr:glutamyl-tRNA reductase [Nocardioidaceae bacterium]
MSVLVVGVSHRTAPVSILERLALEEPDIAKLHRLAVETEHIAEALVVSTCNRIEMYVSTDRFHGSVEDVAALIADQAGMAREQIVGNLYVHYDDAAVAHLFGVTSGLDSMVVGESQILGQVRAALQRGQELATVGPELNVLFQQALRVGKRGHAETDIDKAAPSVVSAALEQIEKTVVPLEQARVLVVGAGAMSGLTVAIASRGGAREIVVVNRTAERARRLADAVGGRAAPWADLGAELAHADIVVSSTGATGTVIGVDDVVGALAHRGTGSAYAVVDLALPRDAEEGVAEIPGVTVIGLAELAESLVDAPVAADVAGVREIVRDEVTAFLSARNAARVTPTVVALRTMATEVVDAELERLSTRRGDLDPDTFDEVAQTVRRVADKLLHAPTVRIKELAGQPNGLTYADALTELFALDQAAVDAVSRVDLHDEDGES